MQGYNHQRTHKKREKERTKNHKLQSQTSYTKYMKTHTYTHSYPYTYIHIHIHTPPKREGYTILYNDLPDNNKLKVKEKNKHKPT